MVRGAAKEDAQKKNAKKAEAMSKSGSQKDAQKAGLKITCPGCKMEMASYKVLQQHFESKHPKLTCPSEAELQG